jgi:hypothetical protein
VATADPTVTASEFFTLIQKIEGYSARDLIGKTFTLSFWARSTKVGTHCVAFYNNDYPSADRYYVAEYNISVADTWEYKEITVIGGLITAGTWDWTNGRMDALLRRDPARRSGQLAVWLGVSYLFAS